MGTKLCEGILNVKNTGWHFVEGTVRTDRKELAVRVGLYGRCKHRFRTLPACDSVCEQIANVMYGKAMNETHGRHIFFMSPVACVLWVSLEYDMNGRGVSRRTLDKYAL